MLQDNYRTPRYLLRDVVEKTVRDALWNFENFPGFKIVNKNFNSNLRETIQKTGVSNDTFERMYLFMCVWGDASTNIYEDGDVTYIAGLTEKVYQDMGFPLINGKQVAAKPNPAKNENKAAQQAGSAAVRLKQREKPRESFKLHVHN